MIAMLRPATPADRPDLVALALAEDAAFSGEHAVPAMPRSGRRAGRPCVPRFVIERDFQMVGEEGIQEVAVRSKAVGPEQFPDIHLEASGIAQPY
jgi:hypothetical protein